MTTHYLACDLGAESGRLMLGSLSEQKLAMEEIHRFPNTPIKAGDSLHWNIPRLFAELQTGLQKAAARRLSIASISADSWGVDYLLLDARGQLMSPTFHYRDARTARGVANVLAKVDGKTIFEETGIQFMPLNTIYQLGAELAERLAQATQLLMIADGFNYLLTGVARIEESNASTSQLYNPRTKQWSSKLMGALQLEEALLPPIVPSGTRLGPLKPEIARDTNLPSIEVVASCSHDTAAAVAAVPAEGEQWAYLSSGTWSLMGVELPSPLITETCRELNFTNEIGYGSSVRLLKNISGMWLIQECRREWARTGPEFDYSTLSSLAARTPPFRSLINPMDERFVAPPSMPEAIASFCRETGQPVPETPGGFVRCVLESLALLYRRTFQQLERLAGRKLARLHLVGGGSRNALLNQFTADALQVPVLAGPTEATAAGNVLIQAIALGHLPSLAAARSVVRSSFEVTQVNPQDGHEWNAPAAQFEKFFA